MTDCTVSVRFWLGWRALYVWETAGLVARHHAFFDQQSLALLQKSRKILRVSLLEIDAIQGHKGTCVKKIRDNLANCELVQLVA